MPRGPHQAFLAVVCLMASAGTDADAQHFGRNKVEYDTFDFKVLETEHFDIYHYAGEEAAAALAGPMAERWYARLSRVLDHQLRGRQPLILYGSHREFSQTNVVSSMLGEGTGGVTESTRRRIVMPFAPTLAETEHVLGHEIAHAFQFDLAARHGGGMAWPLWLIEGMAEYLSRGATDPATTTWLRDAVAHDLLPDRESTAARRFSPYRLGHAMWAYMTGRFGDRLMADVLKAGRAGSLDKRFRAATGLGVSELYAEWREHARVRYPPGERPHPQAAAPLVRRGRAGKLQLGPALSPDGRVAAFFSERDRLSLDLFLADADAGTITAKLATTTASARFEGLQAIRSAGAWSRSGTHFVFAAIQQGQPALVIAHLQKGGGERTIRLPQLGEILAPSWSPDGQAIVFSALSGGVTDLYVYELASGRLRALTRDPFADLQPAWSPDGRQILFVTDRFTSDLASLRFGPCQLAVVDVASGDVRHLPAAGLVKHVSPQWSSDGRSVFFVSNPDGISNVFRLDVSAATLSRVTDLPGGVTGLTETSPALSVAAHAPAIAVTTYRAGHYVLEVHRGPATLAGQPVPANPSLAATHLIEDMDDRLVERLLGDSLTGLPEPGASKTRDYAPRLSLEAIGQPYISSGGGPFGSFVRGGGSLYFGDLLGGRKLATSIQVGSRPRDLALGAYFLNRERRLNWGALAELEPSIRRLPRTRMGEHEGERAVIGESHYFERMQVRGAGMLLYPLNRVQRLELTAGIRHARYRETVRSATRSLETGRIVATSDITGSGGEPVTVGEVSTALVGDTSVHGPVGPILGSRYRLEIGTAVGGLAITRVLADYRRYLMPVRPFTVAARLMHLGQYGSDADDPRLMPTFLGSRYFVRGYGWSSIQCEWTPEGDCPALQALLGSRVAVANLELRAPLMGLLSRDLRYGPLPVETFVFVDSGLVWSGGTGAWSGGRARRLVSSLGTGVRVNAFGIPLELAAVHALDRPARGWSFDFTIRQSF